MADLTIGDYDRIVADDETRLVSRGRRTIAAVDVVRTKTGFVVEGIEACAEDYVSP